MGSDVKYKNLSECFAKYPDTDKDTLHSYADFYENLFGEIRSKSHGCLVEIGVRRGGSIKAWCDWFESKKSGWHIIGMDNASETGFEGLYDPSLDVEPYNHAISLAFGDTLNPQSLVDFKSKFSELCFGKVDILIDDGCHHPYSQVAAFSALYPCVSKGGFYVIEDVENIGFANTIAQMFGGTVEDRRNVKNRHDDILVWWQKK